MAYKVKGIFKGLKFISRILAVKEHEMEIAYPTDVKHVAHIGWDSAAGNASPSWMNEIMASSDFSSLGNFAASTGTSWVSQGFDHDQQPQGSGAVAGSISRQNTATCPDVPWAPMGGSPNEMASPPPAVTDSEAEAAVGVAAKRHAMIQTVFRSSVLLCTSR